MKEHQQKFIGIWKLFEWSVEKPEGDKKYPFSGNVAGYLIYHPDGWMSANLMQNNRVNEISFDGDLLETIKNFFLASNGYVSYAGTFNADKSNVYHNVELSLLPQWVDTTLTREYSFSSKNTLLTLSAEFNGFKDLLVWKKV
jgi:hypothetical protein